MATKEEVQKLASLSRIEVPEADLERFAAEFDSLIGYVGKLDELELPDMKDMKIPEVRNVFREDGEPDEIGAWTEKLLAQFPEKDGNLLSVKQIISHD
ncbi:MAG: aspartyl/glutamyl-tRNA(Asn/Gln) amidotransferase, C subunit [Parcubacteria bacterium C7867-004]|nr:MAG: aspartyl/glutamyl-tRNA(Asn/Gln) amidotransferase, C subunit [Parcubacteria bacterium C7867-004]